MTEDGVYTVSEINEGIKYILGSQFSSIRVEGEVSGVKMSAMKHTYFDLKDQTSLISCVLFSYAAPQFKQNLENGMFVRVSGSITTYNKQSKYQLLVKDIELAGIGPLQIEFEKLKKKLFEEGLFDERRKRPIPSLPKKIAVVTSPTGAAIRDILSILKRRYANMNIIIAPVTVQGKTAAKEIAGAIETLNKNFSDIDVMLVGRGGGSMEDLWCFNEEVVARAIAGSKIPVISCVGHETDFTIADFVADLRAPTPSAAAELVVKNKMELVNSITGLQKRLLQGLRVYYENLSGRFMRLTQSRVLSNPMVLLENPSRNLDDKTEDMLRAIKNKTDKMTEKINLLTGKINALSPLFPLKKGYAIVKNNQGKAVRNADLLKNGETLSLKFYKGETFATVTKNIGNSQVSENKKRNTKLENPQQDTLW